MLLIVAVGAMGFSIQSWIGILAPKGVSQDKLQLLNVALNKALAAP